MSSYVQYNAKNTDKDGIPVYGMDKELQDKKNAKYDKNAEAQVRSWIEQVTGEKFKSNSFHQSLKDGQLLCKLINKIKPGAIPKINNSNMPFMQMENIGYFLKAASDLGLRNTDTFQTVDLYEEKNIPKVIESLMSLGSVVQKIPSYKGPVIGVKLADKTEINFTEEQLRKSANTVGRQYDASINHGNVGSISREVVKVKDTGIRGVPSQQTGGSVAPERSVTISNQVVKTTSVGDTRVTSQQSGGSIKPQSNQSISNSNVKLVSQSSSTSQVVEDIEKLAQLRDRGILSQQEFEAKKKQLLGL
jgi:hypothetical protein